MEKYIYVTEKESRKFRIIKIDDIKIIEPFKGGNGSAITFVMENVYISWKQPARSKNA